MSWPAPMVSQHKEHESASLALAPRKCTKDVLHQKRNDHIPWGMVGSELCCEVCYQHSDWPPLVCILWDVLSVEAPDADGRGRSGWAR